MEDDESDNEEDEHPQMNEYNKLEFEYANLRKKIDSQMRAEHSRNQFKKEKIIELEMEIKSQLAKREYFEGENSQQMNFDELEELEVKLTTLLIKIKDNIRTKEREKLEEVGKLFLCQVCQINEFNIILRPCKHLTVCNDCVNTLLKCPECNEIIERFDRVFYS